jgi:hypothetical protein
MVMQQQGPKAAAFLASLRSLFPCAKGRRNPNLTGKREQLRLGLYWVDGRMNELIDSDNTLTTEICTAIHGRGQKTKRGRNFFC